VTSIYLIGSLRNPRVTEVAAELRSYGWEVFDNWMAAGPTADDSWQEYSKQKGLSFTEALSSYEAKHVFEFDKYHLDRCDMAVLLLPAGKSGHLEIGYMAGKGKPAFALFDAEPERWDVMYQFLAGVAVDLAALIDQLKAEELKQWPYTSVYDKRRKELS
jgi:nucleoside 2-deoxyribosyltransferase